LNCDTTDDSENLFVAVERVHTRSFEHYLAWCSFLSLKPQFAGTQVPPKHAASVHANANSDEFQLLNLLQDLADYFVLWSGAENLRRVSSFILHEFHYRFDGSTAKKFAQTNLSCQQQIESYQLTYDDLDDKTRIRSNNKSQWISQS
jgi:hypothetical protein